MGKRDVGKFMCQRRTNNVVSTRPKPDLVDPGIRDSWPSERVRRDKLVPDLVDDPGNGIRHP
jgi:hypothetical protein